MRYVNIIITVLLMGSAAFGIYLIVLLISNLNRPSVTDLGKTTTESSSSIIVECNNIVTEDEPCFGLVMTTRAEWLAQPPHNPIDRLETPAKNIILTDTKTAECSLKPKCNYLVRNIQEEHMLSNSDICYNFLINSKGDIFEGRGWNLQSAEKDENIKKHTYWVAFIGNFSTIPIRSEQMHSLKSFVDRAVLIGKLTSPSVFYCSQSTELFPLAIPKY